MAVFYTSSTYTKPRKDGKTDKYSYYLTADLQSQSVSNNTSTVLFTLYVYGSSNNGTLMWSTSYANAPTATITVDGTTYSSTISVGSSSSPFYMQSGKIRRYSLTTTPQAIVTQTLTISHDSDGTKYLPVSFNWVAGSGTTTSYYPKSFASNGATITLPAIARSSQISCNSSVLVDNNSSNFSYTVTSYANYYHALSYTLDGNTTTVWSAHNLNTTSTTLTISYATLLSQLTTATAKNLKFTLSTYEDSGKTSLVGTITKTVAVSIDTSVYKPTTTLSSIAPSTTPINGYLVAGYSTASIAYSTTLPEGATGLTVYFSTNKGTLATTSTSTQSGSILTNTLPADTSANYTFTISAYAVDSRGVTSSTVTLTSPTVYLYKVPTITASAIRVASNGSTTEDGAGEYVYITYSATANASVNSQNSIQSTDCVFNGTSYASASWVALQADTEGTFAFSASDNVATVTTSIVVPIAAYPLDLYDDGTAQHLGVGLGGATAEADKVTTAKPFVANSTISATGSITSNSTITSNGNITAQSGDIESSAGNILAPTGKIYAGTTSANYQSAVGAMSAGGRLAMYSDKNQYKGLYAFTAGGTGADALVVYPNNDVQLGTNISFRCNNTNSVTFTFTNLHNLSNTSIYKYGILYGGFGTSGMFMYLIFVTTGNTVSFVPIGLSSQARTFTGSVSGSSLTVTANNTCWGGARLIWIN